MDLLSFGADVFLLNTDKRGYKRLLEPCDGFLNEKVLLLFYSWILGLVSL